MIEESEDQRGAIERDRLAGETKMGENYGGRDRKGETTNLMY